MHYATPPHLTPHWTVTKPAAATCKRGIVVSQSRDAAEVGIVVLKAGGNTIDAAVASALRCPSAVWTSEPVPVNGCVSARRDAGLGRRSSSPKPPLAVA